MLRNYCTSILILALASELCAQTNSLSQVGAQTNCLIWDAITKKHVETGTNKVHVFVFCVTNNGASQVVITNVRPSCGCIVAKMPSQPWPLQPGQGGELSAEVDFTGYYGSFAKLLHVNSSEGYQTLTMQIEVAPPKVRDARQRQVDVDVSRNDKQAPFRGECARCHMIPALGKTGRQLYDAACGICHDSPRRASIVPSLQLKEQAGSGEGRPFDQKRWTEIIVNGGPRLMPAFSASKRGFLAEGQIQALVTFLRDPENRKPLGARKDDELFSEPGSPPLSDSGPSNTVQTRERLNEIQDHRQRPNLKQ